MAAERLSFSVRHIATGMAAAPAIATRSAATSYLESEVISDCPGKGFSFSNGRKIALNGRGKAR